MIELSNFTASNSVTNYTDPPVGLQIVGQVPIPTYARQLRISPNGITFTNGTNTVAISLQNAFLLAINSGDVGLAYQPYFTTQPSSHSIAAPTATSFTVVVSSDIALTYNWQVSTNGGSSWSNASGGVYTNNTTATLNISNSTGLNGYLYRCQVTNTLGTTTSNNATLTVT